MVGGIALGLLVAAHVFCAAFLLAGPLTPRRLSDDEETARDMSGARRFFVSGATVGCVLIGLPFLPVEGWLRNLLFLALPLALGVLARLIQVRRENVE
jgi:hypothetical protein